MPFTLSISLIVFGSMVRTNQLSLMLDNIVIFFGADIRLTCDSAGGTHLRSGTLIVGVWCACSRAMQ